MQGRRQALNSARCWASWTPPERRAWTRWALHWTHSPAPHRAQACRPGWRCYLSDCCATARERLQPDRRPPDSQWKRWAARRRLYSAWAFWGSRARQWWARPAASGWAWASFGPLQRCPGAAVCCWWRGPIPAAPPGPDPRCRCPARWCRHSRRPGARPRWASGPPRARCRRADSRPLPWQRRGQPARGFRPSRRRVPLPEPDRRERRGRATQPLCWGPCRASAAQPDLCWPGCWPGSWVELGLRWAHRRAARRRNVRERSRSRRWHWSADSRGVAATTPAETAARQRPWAAARRATASGPTGGQAATVGQLGPQLAQGQRMTPQQKRATLHCFPPGLPAPRGCWKTA